MDAEESLLLFFHYGVGVHYNQLQLLLNRQLSMKVVERGGTREGAKISY